MGRTLIKVDSVSKTFKLPHEKQSSIKSLFVSMFRGRRTFERQHVLRNVSFEVQEGEFFGIVGRNGSGKSTLLKLLAGIYSPDEGRIDINGRLTPFIELGVGFNPELSGRDNVYLNGALLGFSRLEVAAMYDDIVSFAELERFMDQKLKNYSSGMQVRLAFSIAIRARGDILLLDEVLAVGDAAFQQKCFSYFEQLKKEKKTVVFVSHDMSAITRFCNKAIYVKDGEIIQEAEASEIAEFYKLENIEAPTVQTELSDVHKLSMKLKEQTNAKAVIDFTYESGEDRPMYLGISLLKDGISVAEMTTALDKPLRGNGKISYKLDLSDLNAGVYQVTSVLCHAEDRKLLSVSKKPVKFSIKGDDKTRGGAIKLADTWDY